MRVLSMIRRLFVNISKKLFVFLYTTYVRPHLEYCASIWSPYLVRDIEVLKKVQKQATKLVEGYEKLPYERRLKSLGIYTLFCRCQRGDLIEVFKILNRYYDINPTQFFKPSDVTSTRSHCMMKLSKSHARLRIRSSFLHSELLAVGTVCQTMLLKLTLLDLLSPNWMSTGDHKDMDMNKGL